MKNSSNTTTLIETTKNLFGVRPDMSEHVSKLFNDDSTSDIILFSDNTKISAHRCILSSLPYFKAMFQSNMKESKTGFIDLSNTIPEELLNDFVKYIYRGTLSITFENVIAWLNISQQLLLEDITNKVCECFEKNIGSENCLTILEAMYPFVSLCSLEIFQMVYKRTAECFASNLNAIMKTEEYHQLPWEQVAALLSLNEHSSENSVFEVAMEWMTHNATEIEPNLRHCLSEVVRLPQMPLVNIISNVMNHPILMESTDKNQFYDLLCDAFDYQGKEKIVSSVGKIRYEKRTGYLHEAFKVWSIINPKPAVIEGYYVIEKNPKGFELTFARNSKSGYILQDSGGFRTDYWIGKTESNNEREFFCQNMGSVKHPTTYRYWSESYGNCGTINIKRVLLDFNDEEVGSTTTTL